MVADNEAGKVGTVIMKDMSRLGRNYLQVGVCTEMLQEQGNTAAHVHLGGAQHDEKGIVITPSEEIIGDCDNINNIHIYTILEVT